MPRQTVVVGLDERVPLRSTEPGTAWPTQPPYASFAERFRDAYVAELRAFVDLVAGRIEWPCRGEDALAALQVARACDLAKREGRSVRVAEIELEDAP